MPSWKINCLKSEHENLGTTFTSQIPDETDQIDVSPSTSDHRIIGKYKVPIDLKPIDSNSALVRTTIVSCYYIRREKKHVRVDSSSAQLNRSLFSLEDYRARTSNLLLACKALLSLFRQWAIIDVLICCVIESLEKEIY
jgi:hypothetical protein